MKRSPIARSTKPMVKKRGTSAAFYRRKALTLWGQYIHERDVFCQYCGRGDGKLDAHHIARKEMNATRTDETNGVLLCAFPCHNGVMHGDPFAAVQFYTRRLGSEGYAALRQKAYDGKNGKYPKSFWVSECERLTALLEALP